MEADGASSSPSPSLSPPGSKRRSSRARFRLDDRRPEPSSPSPRPRHSSSSRKRDRKRMRHAPPPESPADRRLQDSAASPTSARSRRRSFQEAAALAVLAAGAARAAPPAPTARSYGAVQRLWSNTDELALLAGAAAFRARNGHVPRLPDMAALFDHLRGSISPHLDQDKVYYKLKRLKSKFQNVPPSAHAGKHELRVRDLCTKVWGAYFGLPPAVEDDAPEEEQEVEPSERRTVPDAAAMLPVATEVLDAYWKTNGLALSGVSLQKGLSLLGTEAARSIEGRWRRQLDAEVRSQMRRHDLAKDVYGLLNDAIKGLGP